jgi:4'-phosphopantetheinyl transferase EntD
VGAVAVIGQVLPAGVAAAEAWGDPPGGWLFPAEEATLTHAADKRRREFTTARQCARAALRRLGIQPAPILPGERGAPRWPAGVVGSMTHCGGYRAAAVARAREMLTVGIDAEPNEPLRAGVAAAITVAGEPAALARLRAWQPAVSWDRLLFSAKESVYKAWFPLTGRWLDFDQAEIALDARTGTFAAQLLVAPPTVVGHRLTGFVGRWLVRNGLLLTAIAVPVARPELTLTIHRDLDAGGVETEKSARRVARGNLTPGLPQNGLR